MNLKSPVKEAGRLFKSYSGRLEKLSIVTFQDFLYHIPSRYNDFSLISPIARVNVGEVVTIQGEVVAISNSFTKSHKALQKAQVQDTSGTIDVIWFNQPYLTKYIKKGDKISLSGKVEFFLHKLAMQSPDYEMLTEGGVTIHTARLVPIYPETKGVSSKWLRRQVYGLLKNTDVVEFLPETIIENYNFLSLSSAIKEIHFPSSLSAVENAKKRLSFDELFLMQLASLKRRSLWQQTLRSNVFKIEKQKAKIADFINKLPFALTAAQQKAIDAILLDFSKPTPMNRLLEGDVGSGKTVVAAIAMYVAKLNGFQSAILAPTEILAQQHYKTITTFLAPFGIRVALVTGSQKLTGEPYDVLIGTHAIIQKNITFEKLGFVVIDEQQRFGVEQRSFMREKGKNPHVLTMTATPIPRTVALALYGDLDVTYLDELPKGRQIIKTWLTPTLKRESAYAWIEKTLKENDSQAFIICPFIEESENMQTVKAATQEYERLKKEVFPNLKVGLLHGRLKSKEKDQVLQDFKERKYDLLVATPVVEVGIDIPNATIIVIEATERFGLSQLHQLRGRVGRGSKQSYCLLFTESGNPQTLQKLKAMETTHIGADLAELDLQIRGSGDIFGTQQHGVFKLKIANLSDMPLLQTAKKEAEQIFTKLSTIPKLVEKVEETALHHVSPD